MQIKCHHGNRDAYFEARKIAFIENFDIIHAHDWLAFPAGIEAKKISKKPLIAHIHATEFDRTGGQGVNKKVYQIEKRGFEEADVIIAVSQFTKERVVRHYHIAPEKIKVIYNATDCQEFGEIDKEVFALKKAGKKIVLFLGRIKK
jgi:glycosyltransferase involved in cell wall biosynthesis